ncbi:MAG: alpha/beta hydrolase [Sandaracinaceae bacterium]
MAPRDWLPDRHLPGFECLTLDLGSDDRGPLVASLVRRQGAAPRPRGVLYLHGFIDYFFHAHVAEVIEAAGLAFYALDLRRHGRSWHLDQLPNYTDDLSEYEEALDAALAVLRDRGVERVALLGHSTGGLLSCLYAQRHPARVDALVLNSPFFEFRLGASGPLLLRGAELLARLAPEADLPGFFSPYYAASLHRRYRGEWDFDLSLKPLQGLPIYAGWVAAVREAQRRLHRGLGLGHPVLALRSARSVQPARWSDDLLHADAVLDVQAIERWAARIGPRASVEAFAGGLHDLFLSPRPVRDEVLARVVTWLGEVLGDAARSPVGQARLPAAGPQRR